MADDFQDFQKRMPSVEKKIAEIKQDDVRVSVIGTVLDVKGKRLAIDDGTGKVEVGFEQPVDAKTGQMVRVLGRVIPMEGGFELQGDALQDMTGLDMELKKMVEELTHQNQSGDAKQ